MKAKSTRYYKFQQHAALKELVPLLAVLHSIVYYYLVPDGQAFIVIIVACMADGSSAVAQSRHRHIEASLIAAHRSLFTSFFLFSSGLLLASIPASVPASPFGL